MEVGKNIKREREKKRLSRAQLAERMGKDVSTIFRWEKGDRAPSTQDLEDVSAALGITLGELLSEGEEVRYEKWVKVPVLSDERMICKLFGTGAFQPKSLEVEFYMMLPCDIVGGTPEESFAVRAQGDSMAPEVPDGAICLVNPNELVTDGDIALVAVNEALLIKRVYREMGGRIELRSENDKFPQKAYGQDAVDKGWVRVIGKVKAVITVPKRKS